MQHGENVTYHIIENMNGMLARYYVLRGWDEDGIPTEAKLRELGLEDVV